MDSLEAQARKLLEKHCRISPALVAVKLKITYAKAEELCLAIWISQAHEWFNFRHFGLGCELMSGGK